MTDYELAVRLLHSRNTHLKLRERCRVALRQLKRSQRPLSPNFMQIVYRAIHLRKNAVSYEERKFPGWKDLPKELTETVEASYPLSGHGMADLNTMIHLKRLAAEAEAELALEPVPEPSEAEIDQMIQDYLAYRQTLPKW
jgi:hypothetical protein